jgi:hypothetical protein
MRCGLCHTYGHYTEDCEGPHRYLTDADLTPCTRCHLRGHVAGDPDRCLYYRGSYGLGGHAAVAAMAGYGGDSFDYNGRGRRKDEPFHRNIQPRKMGAVRPARPG